MGEISAIKTLERHRITERELITRALNGLKKGYRKKQARWVHVMKDFGVGSTVANAICHEYNVDPDEVV